MNTNKFGNGDPKMPEAPVELVFDANDDVETIQSKTAEHNEAVRKYHEDMDNFNKQLYARTKKAEGFEFKEGKWVKPDATPENKEEAASKTTNRNLSDSDLLYLSKTSIHEEDLEEVLTYAKNNNVDVKKAHEYLKPILDIRIEQRNTAETTNTGGGPRGNSKLSDETLLSNASKGILPESDEDMKRLTLLQIKKNRG